MSLQLVNIRFDIDRGLKFQGVGRKLGKPDVKLKKETENKVKQHHYCIDN